MTIYSYISKLMQPADTIRKIAVETVRIATVSWSSFEFDTQCFSAFLSCYPKSHTDVGSLPPLPNHAQTTFFTEIPVFFGCTPIKKEQMKHYRKIIHFNLTIVIN